MQSISQPSQLATLSVSPALKAFLKDHLINHPFGNLENAEQFWHKNPTQLILLEPLDQLQHLSNTLLIHQLHQLTHFPEYVLKAPDNHFLTVTITGQSGSGLYLLFPDNIQIEALQQLKRLAE